MKRGDLVLVALRGDIGKARPAVVIESDNLPATRHVLLCPLTSELNDEIILRRVFVAPHENNGVLAPSQVMIDKIHLVRREKCGRIIGRMDRATMDMVSDALALVLGLAD